MVGAVPTSICAMKKPSKIPGLFNSKSSDEG